MLVYNMGLKWPSRCLPDARRAETSSKRQHVSANETSATCCANCSQKCAAQLCQEMPGFYRPPTNIEMDKELELNEFGDPMFLNVAILKLDSRFQ